MSLLNTKRASLGEGMRSYYENGSACSFGDKKDISPKHRVGSRNNTLHERPQGAMENPRYENES